MNTRARKVFDNLEMMEHNLKGILNDIPQGSMDSSELLDSNQMMIDDPSVDLDDSLFEVRDLDAAEVVFEENTNSEREESNEVLHSQAPLWEEKLSNQHPYSLYETYTLLLYFIVKLGVSSSQIDFVLTFIQGFLPADNRLPQTKHLFMRSFSAQLPMRRVYFCREHQIVSGRWTCTHCKKESFLWCNPVRQFVNRLKNDKSFYDLAQTYRVKHSVRNANTNSDVYDGTVYQAIAAPITRLSGGYSFILNYDGASKWKSSKTSAIPIYMVCNELPFEERFKIENVIFCGVWFGQEKPESNILFSVLIEELQEIEKGILSVDPYGRQVLVRARCINSCCDLPAKAALFYQQQHGGKGACNFCNNQGCKINTRFCYPLVNNFQNEKLNHSVRSEDDILRIYKHYDRIREVDEGLKFPVMMGINGKSVFSKLPYWRWTQFGSIDFMHLFMGLFRMLMKLWSEAKCNNGSARVSSARWAKFDKLLCSQEIPSVFHRKLRSIVEHHKYWKASECMIFLLYTSRLTNFLFPSNTPFYDHHMLLVDSLNRILKVGQTDEELNSIEKQLFLYVLKFQTIYGEQYVTLNVHLLTHLVQSVRMHGPLVCYSAFPFEGYNHVIMSAIHGTNRVEQGISRAIPLYQHLQFRINSTINEETRKFMRKLKVRQFFSSHGVQVDGYYLSGKNGNFTSLRSPELFVRVLNTKKNKNQGDSFVRLKDGRVACVNKIEIISSKVSVTVRLLVTGSTEKEEMIYPQEISRLVMILRDFDGACIHSVDVLPWHPVLLI